MKNQIFLDKLNNQPCNFVLTHSWPHQFSKRTESEHCEQFIDLLMHLLCIEMTSASKVSLQKGHFEVTASPKVSRFIL